MSHRLPVIASRIGALPEIVEDGINGFLFGPGDAGDLAGKMQLLWGSPRLCDEMGKVALDKVLREYREDLYYKRLMNTYRKAIELNRKS